MLEVLAAACPSSTLSAITKPRASPAHPFYETDATWDEVYPQSAEAGVLPPVSSTSPWMLDIMARIQGCEPWVYPIKMARIATPANAWATKPHRTRTPTLTTAGPTMAGVWVALHDVDASMGRVTLVLPGSHKGGVRKVFQAQGVGGVQCEIYASTRLTGTCPILSRATC